MTRRIFQWWESPQVDLFATRTSRKCQQFCSLQGRSQDSLTDVFLFPLSERLLCAFLPIPLIHEVLLKIRQDRVRVLFIVPVWAHQHWFSALMNLSMKSPILFPVVLDLISQGHDWLLHLNLQVLHLTTWMLHG